MLASTRISRLACSRAMNNRSSGYHSTIDSVTNLNVDASDPNWYGNAKARAFLPRTLNDLASQFPPDVLTVRFAPSDGQQGWFRLVSIQPTSR